MLNFRKHQRLLQASDFQTLFKTGRKHVSKCFVLYAAENQLPRARLGIVVSKKVSRLAVSRNRLKRVIRESFRTHQQILMNKDLIVVARSDINKLSKQALAQLLEHEWLKLIKP